MMNVVIELNKDQMRKVVVDSLTDNLILQKQYFSSAEIMNYKWMLREFATLVEIDAIADRFDKAWPNNVKWYDQ